jgi:hypothetical protein
MAPKATEIGIFPIKAGLDIESGDAKATLEDIMKTVTSQPGNINTFSGRQVENPDLLWLAIGKYFTLGHRSASQHIPASSY